MKPLVYLNSLTSVLFLILISSCSTGEKSNSITGIKSDCIEHFIEEFNMKTYDGEDLECNTFIRLYQYEEVYFAFKNNHCADFAPFAVFDCNGNEFCFTSLSPCHLQESTDFGIIGIEK